MEIGDCSIYHRQCPVNLISKNQMFLCMWESFAYFAKFNQSLRGLTLGVSRIYNNPGSTDGTTKIQWMN